MFKPQFHQWCQIPSCRAISLSLSTENNHYGPNSENMATEGEIVARFIKFDLRDYAHLHPCIVLVESNFLLSQMRSVFPPDLRWTSSVRWHNIRHITIDVLFFEANRCGLSCLYTKKRSPWLCWLTDSPWPPLALTRPEKPTVSAAARWWNGAKTFSHPVDRVFFQLFRM